MGLRGQPFLGLDALPCSSILPRDRAASIPSLAHLRAQPGSAPDPDAALLTQLPPRRECPSIGRLMKIKTHACARLPVLLVENALHISPRATFPNRTQSECHSELHLTVEETEVQGRVLLNGEHPFSGSFQKKESSCHLLSTVFTRNLTAFAGFQRKCMSYPDFYLLNRGGRCSQGVSTKSQERLGMG